MVVQVYKTYLNLLVTNNRYYSQVYGSFKYILILLILMKEMSKSSARLIVLLSNVKEEDKYGSKLARLLDINYNYLSHLMLRLETRGWIGSLKRNKKRFFFLLKDSPLTEAKTYLMQTRKNNE